jgi:EPTP domain
MLREHQRLNTSGARAVEVFRLDNEIYLAVPQLAEDRSDTEPDMNGGDSDVPVQLYRWKTGRFELSQLLPSSGAEDAEFFQIGERSFLAIARIRKGRGPYSMDVMSQLFEWDGGIFKWFQDLPSFAAKQCRSFSHDGGHFLGIACGVRPPEVVISQATASPIYRWNGVKFQAFQSLPSDWAYDLSYFAIGDNSYVGLADHLLGVSVYRWEAGSFQPFWHDSTPGTRSFAWTERDGIFFLALANISHPSSLYRWNGTTFEKHQEFEGPGGRAFCFHDDALVRINFMEGNRTAPVTELSSQIYRWDGDSYLEDSSFITSGGTDATTFEAEGRTYLVVSNSLSSEVRFRTDSVVYELT